MDLQKQQSIHPRQQRRSFQKGELFQVLSHAHRRIAHRERKLQQYGCERIMRSQLKSNQHLC